MDYYIKIVFFFFAYSMMGWVWESCYESVLNRKILNRGFLLGPYIPLYGFGGLVSILFLQQFQAPLISMETLTVYLIGSVGATILEYVTSYVLEKTLKARWWDYSNYPLNLNGRICLIATLFWGIVAIAAVDFLNPFLLKVMNRIPHDLLLILLTMLSTTMFIDFCVTINSTLDLQKRIQLIISMEKDIALETIANKKDALLKYRDRILEIGNPFTKRIVRDFPLMKFTSKNFEGVYIRIRDYLSNRKK